MMVRRLVGAEAQIEYMAAIEKVFWSLAAARKKNKKGTPQYKYIVSLGST
jgi:hypothetical protein